MNAVADIATASRQTPSGLQLNAAPFRQDWFDETPVVRDVVAERRHRQERLAGASACSRTRASTAASPATSPRATRSSPIISGSTRSGCTSRASRSPTCCWSTRTARSPSAAAR